MSSNLLRLYGPNGKSINARRADLEAIQNMNFDKKAHRRAVNDVSGRYWLISDQSGYHAMLLGVRIFNRFPRPTGMWEITYEETGIAEYQEFDLERAIREFSKRGSYGDENDRAPLPASVAAIARQRVRYRLGVTHGDKLLAERHSVRTRDAATLRPLLAKFMVDPSPFLKALAGKSLSFGELLLTLIQVCDQHYAITNRELLVTMLTAIVRSEDHDKLLKLMARYDQM